MKAYILPLATPQADLETVGGKGLSLARLLNAGLPVPDGFHLTTDAYRAFVSANAIQGKILAALQGADGRDAASLEKVSAAIGRLFEEGEIPAAIRSDLQAAYLPLKGAPVAVRSSATAEDLADASFAGQQETYLNICGFEALLKAIKKCWASLWTARAIAYRLKNQVDQETVALAVVVQELVFADAAGILFTANPVNGRRREALINAAWGLGEAIVSGAVTPDTLTVDKSSGKILRREVAEKLVMTVRTGGGTSEQPVPGALQKKAVLTARQTAELAAWGVKIEGLYGAPMDIEWALAGGKFFIVQARPITAMPPDWILPDPKAVYARGSLAEHIPGPVTPLFATLGLTLANAATAKIWEGFIGRETAAQILGKGFYLPLNDFVYGGFRMGMKESWAVMKITFSQVLPTFRGSVPRYLAGRAKFASLVKDWEAKDIESMTPVELLEGVRTIFYQACRYFTTIQTTLPAASMSEILFVRFYNSLVKRKQDPDASVFLVGFDSVSVRAEKSLYDLAMWVRANPALRAYLLDTPVDALEADFNSKKEISSLPSGLAEEWRARFQRHVNEFAHTSYDFDFANPTPAEKPGPLLEAVKSFVAGHGVNPHERQAAAVARREQSTRATLARLGWPLKGWFIKLLKWAQETGPSREDSIADMGMGHPLVRRMLVELGRRFAQGKAIEAPDDIYWLEEAEVEALARALENNAPLPSYAGRIPARKAAWQAALKINPPVMLPEKSGWSKFVHGEELQKKDGKLVLKGVGTSSGIVTAPARVIFSPEDFGQMCSGDVLVAVTTNPAWTPLFTLASAVVTDIGGPLSHSSIVAREYGIPAVMAARSATRVITSGQLITVDGGKGIVLVDEK